MSTMRLVKRLQHQVKSLNPGSEDMKAALTRIGVLIQAQTKFNLVSGRTRAFDKGGLLNSINFELYQEGSLAGVKVGSFGIPYAAVQEYGFSGKVTVPSYTRRTKNGSSVVSAHTRDMNIKAKWYLRTAVRTHRNKIIDIMREAIFYANK